MVFKKIKMVLSRSNVKNYILAKQTWKMKIMLSTKKTRWWDSQNLLPRIVWQEKKDNW